MVAGSGAISTHQIQRRRWLPAHPREPKNRSRSPLPRAAVQKHVQRAVDVRPEFEDAQTALHVGHVRTMERLVPNGEIEFLRLNFLRLNC
eukprot:SAG31_NODE_3022_length_4780_cov_10.130955_5_plen_90_part_00